MDKGFIKLTRSEIEKAIDVFYELGGSFVMPGFYELPQKVSEIIFLELLRGNTKPLVEYHKISSFELDVSSSHDSYNIPYLDEEEYQTLFHIYSNEGFWNITSVVQNLDKSLEYIEKGYRNYTNYISYKARRRRANSRISSKKIT